jgi:hypothetical protein
MTKKLIWVEVAEFDIDWTDINAAIAVLTDIKNEYANTKCYLSRETRNYSDDTYVSIRQERLETDEEESVREYNLQKLITDISSREREEFLRLQAKYGTAK